MRWNLLGAQKRVQSIRYLMNEHGLPYWLDRSGRHSSSRNTAADADAVRLPERTASNTHTPAHRAYSRPPGRPCQPCVQRSCMSPRPPILQDLSLRLRSQSPSPPNHHTVPARGASHVAATHLPTLLRSSRVSVTLMNLRRLPSGARSPSFSPLSRLSNLPMEAVDTPASRDASLICARRGRCGCSAVTVPTNITAEDACASAGCGGHACHASPWWQWKAGQPSHTPAPDPPAFPTKPNTPQSSVSLLSPRHSRPPLAPCAWAPWALPCRSCRCRRPAAPPPAAARAAARPCLPAWPPASGWQPAPPCCS